MLMWLGTLPYGHVIELDWLCDRLKIMDDDKWTKRLFILVQVAIVSRPAIVNHPALVWKGFFVKGATA